MSGDIYVISMLFWRRGAKEFHEVSVGVISKGISGGDCLSSFFESQNTY